MAKDFYKTLGVEKNASAEVIKKSYRKMAMQYHPDQNKGDSRAEAKFKEISEAYDVLKDEQKRAAYDRFGAAVFDGSMGGRPGGGQGGFNSSDFAGFSGAFSEIFEDMFGDLSGRAGGGRSAGRGQDLQYTLEITLEDAFKGKESTVKIPLNDVCEPCKGSGAEAGSGAENCTTCDGHGRIRQQQGFFTIERTCPVCGGQGKVIKNPCKSCSGTGRVRKDKSLKVKIPPGVEHGRRIRLTGEGEAGLRGAARGDLYILLSVRKHGFFEREGANLFCRVPMTITRAALGGEIEVPTIENSRAKVKVPPGTQSGRQFRLKGKGMSILGSDARGDMFIEIFVETPVNLDKKQEELLRQLDKSMGGDGQVASRNSPEFSGFFAKMKDIWSDLKD